jgi:glycosyltransferase involved in cell wall biosynthesis
MASVDVAVPCYNYGRFLGECVSSVLAQDGVDVRVLIIDNASEDDSLAVARSLAAADPRVEVIAHATNRGASFSYNEGIDWAAADYFLLLDADDLLAPGALGRAAAVLDRYPEVSFAYGIEARVEDDGTVRAPRPAPGRPGQILTPGPEFIRQLCRTPVNCIGANTVVRRTAAQKRVGHYRPALRYTDDLEMWLRLATVGGAASIMSVQAMRRYHAARMSVEYQSMQVRDFVEREKAFESFFAHEGSELADAPALLAAARRGLGEHAYWSAVSHLSRGQRRVGIELLRLSHRWRPRAALVPPVRWLLRMEHPVQRAVEILSEAFARRAGSRRARPVGGERADPTT